MATGSWQQRDAGGKQADVFQPAEWPEVKTVVLFLHGHARITLRDNEVFTRELERYGMGAVCPDGKRCWWTDLVCPEFDPQLTPIDYLRNNVLEWLDCTWGVRPPAIALLGVSMGGQGALRLAYWYPQLFPVVAALSPTIDYQNLYGKGLPLDDLYPDREAARQDTVTLQLHPLNWPRHQLLTCDPTDTEWFDGVERLASKLSSTGIPFDSDLTTRHGGHSWDYFNFIAPAVMKFLHEGLDQEQRRIPAPRSSEG
jgi:pimeloyl-ACP methyl ester carboxylesterase